MQTLLDLLNSDLIKKLKTILDNASILLTHDTAVQIRDLINDIAPVCIYTTLRNLSNLGSSSTILWRSSNISSIYSSAIAGVEAVEVVETTEGAQRRPPHHQRHKRAAPMTLGLQDPASTSIWT